MSRILNQMQNIGGAQLSTNKQKQSKIHSLKTVRIVLK